MRVGAAWLSVSQADGSPAVDIPVDVLPIDGLLASLRPPVAAA
jgi:hypothetical protein